MERCECMEHGCKCGRPTHRTMMQGASRSPLFRGAGRGRSGAKGWPRAHQAAQVFSEGEEVEREALAQGERDDAHATKEAATIATPTRTMRE